MFDQGIDHAHVVSPNDTWRSILFLRVNTLDGLKMPPLAHEVSDEKSIRLLRQWIESLGGPTVLPPPSFSPQGGHFPGPIEVTLSHPEPGTAIYFTLDGSVPTKTDPLFVKPIRLEGPTTVRARAFKEGFTRSIVAQETFIIGE
jgi:hypothetical protein